MNVIKKDFGINTFSIAHEDTYLGNFKVIAMNHHVSDNDTNVVWTGMRERPNMNNFQSFFYFSKKNKNLKGFKRLMIFMMMFAFV